MAVYQSSYIILFDYVNYYVGFSVFIMFYNVYYYYYLFIYHENIFKKKIRSKLFTKFLLKWN